MKRTTVFAIGRWMPIHLGHKEFLIKLAKAYDQLVIGVGSCYENGTPRNCIPAVEREKLLRKILKTEGVENAVIIPIEDRETFEEWITDICRVCDRYQVTHFCTGNKEDILNVLTEKGIKLNVKMINPEETSSFPFHATDIRNAILNDDTDKLDQMIPQEIKPMVLEQISREILRASRGEGQFFIPGRQTVDLIFIVQDQNDHRNYVLIGKRRHDKRDFPDFCAIPGTAIMEFESPIDAAIRGFYDETGIQITLLDNSKEPADIIINTLRNQRANLSFTGIYASHDNRINGTQGGGSQCFAVHINGDVAQISRYLRTESDLTELEFINVDNIHKMTLAYDQKRMLLEAFVHLGISYDNGEELATIDENGNPSSQGVQRSLAHENGILHAASHVFIYKKANNHLYFLLQRRAACKDSFPNCLDMTSGGHVEKGYDFISTAQKELHEELGITVSAQELTTLFSQVVEYSMSFHNRPFIDREINVVFALEKDLDPSHLKLQESEVQALVWLTESEILDKIKNADPELCLNPEEFKKVLSALNPI